MNIQEIRDNIKESMIKILVDAKTDLSELGTEIGLAIGRLTDEEIEDFIHGIRHGLDLCNKHEYLESSNYYESKHIGSGRTDKTCEHCRGEIPKGCPHEIHKFYGDGDWPTYPTHIECSEYFIKSLR